MRFRFALSAVGAVLSSAVMLGGSITPTVAQSVEFRGTATVTAKSKACSQNGWVVGEKTKANMRYRPPRLGSNGKTTKIALFYPYWATSYVLETGVLGKSFKPVHAYGMSAAPYPYANGAEVRVTSLTPSVVTPSTKTVKIKGEVRGFDEMADCVVTFAATLKPR